MSPDRDFLQEIRFREIGPADIHALTSFFLENNRPDVTRYFAPFPLDAESAGRIANESGRDVFAGAFLGPKMIGFAMLRGWNEGYAVPSFGVLVDHRYQGRGIGSHLLEMMLRAAMERDCSAVRLTVTASNTRALQWYLSAGFVELSREPLAVAGKQDVKIIAFKELRSPTGSVS